MNIETYNKAKELQDKISKLEYELKVLREPLPTVIRFGGSYNVSVPIEIDEYRLASIVDCIVTDKKMKLEQLKEQFNAI